ncbi:MAG: universal stress protein [Saprospiraceae bacterium]
MPLLSRRKDSRIRAPHGVFSGLEAGPRPQYKAIAVTIDFSHADQLALRHALEQGQTPRYLLFHAVETAGAIVMGDDIHDYEAESDKINLEKYGTQLQEMGYTCETVIGYGSPKKAIPKMVQEQQPDLLVMGAHGHTGLMDLVLGTTVGAVRHAVRIPVLIVR